MLAEEAVVPSLWCYLSRLRLRVDRSPDENMLLRMARVHRLSVCDAAYLELAHREGLPLATLDTDLGRAAAGEGVALVSSGEGERDPVCHPG